MLDVRRLRLLREVKLRGTLAAVAEALAYSPSSVSQQLSLLEAEAGVPLLEKAGRRVILTPQAELLVARAEQVLDILERAEDEVASSLGEVRGTVRLAVFQSAAHAILPAALTILREAYPQLRVEVTEREPDAGLFEVSARDFDLVIAEQYPGHTRAHRSDLDRVVLGGDAIRLGVGGATAAALPDASAQHHALRQITEGRAWVMEPVGTASREWAMQLCRAAGFEPDVRFETADLMAHIRLIRSGNAVGLLPDLVWAGEAPSVRLVDLPADPHRTIFTAARRSSADREAVAVCRAALAQAVALVTPAR
ncbi:MULTISPECIES: LysR family transcriptional regulator [unclassified Leifsonia]|uniref:LysR family transcriptional regulator n=1 Tax=unclassified Leifsonia TaxID=2663824 RepID=UPI0006F4A411|nr:MULTISPECIES: LysR substrate-binding domain-containing protein [unclassified Leifsonia]KQX05247.1 LysR family transcriptional regulator [Leifsonia sp. Root1293]KRA08880.1 LysR family transcriptional regulator [Leifsonia sp. Root60]